MTRLPGRPVLGTLDIEDYVRQLATSLVQLHRVPIDRLDFLPDQAELLSASLGKSKLADDLLEPGLRQAVRGAWPTVSVAPTCRTLVHGDYWPGNVLWQRGQLTGVVDWEEPRLGDPTRDLAVLCAAAPGPDAESFLDIHAEVRQRSNAIAVGVIVQMPHRFHVSTGPTGSLASA